MNNEPLIVKIGKEKFKKNKDNKTLITPFLKDEEKDIFLNDLVNYPHAFILACLMDKQIKAEKAWEIPVKIYKEFGTFDIYKLAKKSEKEYIKIFQKHKLHRFNVVSAKVFSQAVKDIINKYDGDVSIIWANNPSSASVVYKFLEFEGCGKKIATMIANILVRDFKIPFSDYYSIDISPDVHVQRVMKRMGFVDKNATLDMVIYKARELYPKFPGIIDFSCWEIGKNYCRPNSPKCKECIVNSECKKVI